MRSRRLAGPRLLTLVLAASTTLLSCGHDRCETSTVETWQSNGMVTLTAPARFTFACAASIGWVGFGGNSFITMSEGCSTDSSFQGDVILPSDGGPAVYALPSADVSIMAFFYPSSGAGLSIQFKSLTLVSGTITVQSRGTYNVEADVDIQLDTDTAERISITGHILETGCRLGQSTNCE